MEYVKTSFSRELSTLLKKHKRVFTSDNGGIYIVLAPDLVTILIGKSTDASEDSREKLLFIVGHVDDGELINDIKCQCPPELQEWSQSRGCYYCTNCDKDV